MKNPFVYGLLLGDLGTSGVWILATNEFPIPARVVGGIVAGVAFLICLITAHDY